VPVLNRPGSDGDSGLWIPTIWLARVRLRTRRAQRSRGIRAAARGCTSARTRASRSRGRRPTSTDLCRVLSRAASMAFTPHPVPMSSTRSPSPTSASAACAKRCDVGVMGWTDSGTTSLRPRLSKVCSPLERPELYACSCQHPSRCTSASLRSGTQRADGGRPVPFQMLSDRDAHPTVPLTDVNTLDPSSPFLVTHEGSANTSSPRSTEEVRSSHTLVSVGRIETAHGKSRLAKSLVRRCWPPTAHLTPGRASSWASAPPWAPEYWSASRSRCRGVGDWLSRQH
jgi:hypothetical protein